MHLQDVSGCLLMMAHDVRFVPVVRFARIRLITGYWILDTNSCFTGYCTDAFEDSKIIVTSPTSLLVVHHGDGDSSSTSNQ